MESFDNVTDTYCRSRLVEVIDFRSHLIVLGSSHKRAGGVGIVAWVCDSYFCGDTPPLVLGFTDHFRSIQFVNQTVPVSCRPVTKNEFIPGHAGDRWMRTYIAVVSDVLVADGAVRLNGVTYRVARGIAV